MLSTPVHMPRLIASTWVTGHLQQPVNGNIETVLLGQPAVHAMHAVVRAASSTSCNPARHALASSTLGQQQVGKVQIPQLPGWAYRQAFQESVCPGDKPISRWAAALMLCY